MVAIAERAKIQTSLNGAESSTPSALHAKVLRSPVTIFIPREAYERLQAKQLPLLEAIDQALEIASHPTAPEETPVGKKMLRISVTPENAKRISEIAEELFHGDQKLAASWLVARGVGIDIPVPTEEDLKREKLPYSVLQADYEAQRRRAQQEAADRRMEQQRIASFRRAQNSRGRSSDKDEGKDDDSVPTGPGLKARREAIGISQKDLADRMEEGKRSTVAEVERGKRQGKISRLRMHETLLEIEREKAEVISS